MRPANTPTVLSPDPHAEVTTPTQGWAQRPSPWQAGRQGGSHSSHSQEAECLQALRALAPGWWLTSLAARNTCRTHRSKLCQLAALGL